MKFEIWRASNWQNESESPCNKAYVDIEYNGSNEKYLIDINTLEELMELIEEIDEDVIVNKDRILIYDSWLE